MTDKLEIFVSGKEDELADERAIADDLIQSLGFQNTGSENRSASEGSMEEEYSQEVRHSEIYVGIFYKIFSEPSIREYKTAQENNLAVLIFIKNLNRDRNPNVHRDPKLENFLKDIKDPRTGRVVKYFNNVLDLRNELKDAMVKCVSKRFRKTQDIYIEEEVEKLEGRIESPLARGHIIDFEIPPQLKRGTKNIIKARVKGKGNYMFLTLAIIDPDKKQNWFADNDTIDLTLNAGNKKLDDEEYYNSWEFVIFDNAKPGTHVAFLGLYEDTFDLPTVNRRLVAYKMRNIEVL